MVNLYSATKPKWTEEQFGERDGVKIGERASGDVIEPHKMRLATQRWQNGKLKRRKAIEKWTEIQKTTFL